MVVIGKVINSEGTISTVRGAKTVAKQLSGLPPKQKTLLAGSVIFCFFLRESCSCWGRSSSDCCSESSSAGLFIDAEDMATVTRRWLWP